MPFANCDGSMNNHLFSNAALWALPALFSFETAPSHITTYNMLEAYSWTNIAGPRTNGIAATLTTVISSTY